MLCCVVFRECTGEKAFVKRDSALLERFCVSETMFTPCYLLVQCRTNLDDYRIFVYFERIVKVLEGGFSFFIATGLRKIYDFPRCGRFFCVHCVFTGHLPFPVQVMAPDQR